MTTTNLATDPLDVLNFKSSMISNSIDDFKEMLQKEQSKLNRQISTSVSANLNINIILTNYIDKVVKHSRLPIQPQLSITGSVKKLINQNFIKWHKF